MNQHVKFQMQKLSTETNIKNQEVVTRVNISGSKSSAVITALKLRGMIFIQSFACVWIALQCREQEVIRFLGHSSMRSNSAGKIKSQEGIPEKAFVEKSLV